MTRDDELLELERSNVTRIERLEAAVGGVREDVAKVLAKLDHPTDSSHKWALGVILTAVGSAFLILWQADANMRSEVSESVRAVAHSVEIHTQDNHPSTVLGEVGRLDERLKATDARLDLIFEAVVESMKSGSKRGREQAEDRGRLEEGLRSLRDEMKIYHTGETDGGKTD